ncbi:MAG: hypothetical protein RIC14_06605 [Filomicrobium sp.]
MKLFLKTWLAAFVVVTPVLYATQPLMNGWPIWAKAFVISGVMVFAMQLVIMPIIMKQARA